MTTPSLFQPTTEWAGRRRGCRLLLAAAAIACLVGAARAAEPEATFLPAVDGLQSWRRTLEAVASEWPVARVVEPDFLAIPPREGLIESSWVEPSAGETLAWPPRRQRLVVRVVPGHDGVWIDAAVQTQALAGAAAGGGGVELVGGWRQESESAEVETRLVAQLAPSTAPIRELPPIDQEEFLGPPQVELPWSRSSYPRLSRAGHKIARDYRNFYDCDGLVSTAAAFGAGALMANTGFDDTMQTAWQQGVEPPGLGTFFSGCKDIGEGRYVLPICGAAAAPKIGRR